MNKRGFEFSFGWLFAIIVGAVIISLAIYAAVKLIGTERNVSNTYSAKEIGILLTPLETGMESGISNKINFQSETRLYFGCRTSGNFGAQDIGLSASSGIGSKWVAPGRNVSFYNKYIFSRQIEQGKSMSVFAIPFEFPFKIADTFIVWSGDYCLVSPPKEMAELISNLNDSSIRINESSKNCKPNSVKVCFDSSEKCEVKVSTNTKKVTKNGTSVYYEGNLVYGAIFSDPGIYECQVKRIMKRASLLSSIYLGKSDNLAPLGCNSNMAGDLLEYLNQTSSLTGSSGLYTLEDVSDRMKLKNDERDCTIF